MRWLRRVCSMGALAVLSAVSMHGNAYVLSANPASPAAGESTILTLSGDLSAISFLSVTVTYDSSRLAALLPPDELSVLDDGVTGKADAFAFYDNVAGNRFDYLVVAGLTDLSMSNGPILSIAFDTLGAGPALVTFNTCAATALQTCDPNAPDFAGSSRNDLEFTLVPEPSSILMVLAALLVGAALRRQRRARLL